MISFFCAFCFRRISVLIYWNEFYSFKSYGEKDFVNYCKHISGLFLGKKNNVVLTQGMRGSNLFGLFYWPFFVGPRSGVGLIRCGILFGVSLVWPRFCFFFCSVGLRVTEICTVWPGALRGCLVLWPTSVRTTVPSGKIHQLGQQSIHRLKYVQSFYRLWEWFPRSVIFLLIDQYWWNFFH